MGKKWRYGVVLDAGSSGTRLHIYKWKDPSRARKHASKQELSSLPKLHTEKKWTKKIKPGVSTFGENPTAVGPDHLKGLIHHALDVIPEDQVEDTPIFLMATAGMRLLPQAQQSALTSEICSYLQETTDFSLPDCDLHIQVIPGETEGLYGWIATNYLLGGFDRPEDHDHGKGHNTYGFLDMGGASAQIAFAPNATEAAKHANDLKLLRLRTLDGERSEYRVFTATWLGFGVNQAREAYVNKLVEMYDPDVREIPDACLPKGLHITPAGEPVDAAQSTDLTLLGTGDFTSCLRHTYPLLGKDAPCEDTPCLLNGQHVPAIDFDVNHFVGVSEYWHTTHGVFDKGDQAYDLKTYQNKVEDFCTQDWDTIVSTKVDARKKTDNVKEAQEACFKASWLINVLHDGIGVPRLGLDHTPDVNASQSALEEAKGKGFLDPFQPVDKIDGIEVSWTLGPMVLYAAGQTPPRNTDSLPVGFGSNVNGIPADFNYAGSSWKMDDDDDDDWDDTIEDLVDHAKPSKSSSFLLFILVLLLVGYVFRKRERRTRFVNKFNGFTGRWRKFGSPKKSGRGFSGLTSKLFGRNTSHYERVIEEGEANQFELGDVDSDENEHSDSSDGSKLGKTSGLATPKLNLERFDSGSVLDRGGLIVRTESRERLVPPNLSSVGRSRSRAGSPTRLKSPLMTPLAED
ncbi:Golgi apyrase [Cytospora mali]|uniref:Golgi apyrase n=1 Tax=Cytospora mali TaxID=578113 RepID=A0A194VY67_CYTMA|nr:Golgi apyrase [Valsa mali]